MKIISIEIQNFKPFRNLVVPQEGELPDGLILIKGPNSTGKSSLFEAILWAIWGPTTVDLTNDELVSFSSSFCKVSLIFEVSGHRYKIERSYDSASGMNVILYHKTGSSWKRVADKTRTVETEIESILNISSKQALNTLLVRQGEVALIANATPSVLRGMLVEIYNLDLLDKMEDQLRNLENDLTNRYNALEYDYTNPEYIRQKIEEAKEKIVTQKAALKEKASRVKEAEKTLKKLPDSNILETLYNLQQQFDRIKVELEGTLKTRDLELSKDKGLLSADEQLVLARMASLKKQSQQYTTTEDQLKDEISEIDFEVGSLLGEGKRLQKASDTLQSDEDAVNCPTCLKPLTVEERNSILGEYRRTIKNVLSRAEELKQKREELSENMQHANNRKHEISKLVDSIGRVIELQKDVNALESQSKEIQNKLSETLTNLGIKSIDALLKKHDSKDITDLHRTLTRLEGDLRSSEAEYKSLEDAIQEEENRITKLGEDIATMKSIGAEMENLKSLREHTQYVRRKLV
ncbi:MAG: AAA family ATPase, partial [Candidatus Thorarchaeota archaeon]